MKGWRGAIVVLCSLLLPVAVLAQQKFPLKSETGVVLWNRLVFRELPVTLVVTPLLENQPDDQLDNTPDYQSQAIVEFSSTALEQCVKTEVIDKSLEISLEKDCFSKNGNISVVQNSASNNRVIVNGVDISRTANRLPQDSIITVHLPQGMSIGFNSVADIKVENGFQHLSLEGDFSGNISLAKVHHLDLKLDGAGEVLLSGGDEVNLQLSGAASCSVSGDRIESLGVILAGATSCEVNSAIDNLDIRSSGASSIIFEKAVDRIKRLDLFDAAQAEFCMGHPVPDELKIIGAAVLSKECRK